MPNLSAPKGLQLILASQSPRRKALLADLGYEFRQISKETDESFPSDLAKEKVAAYLSEKKAKAYLSELSEKDLLITSDTIVLLENEILNKPGNVEEAQGMLRKLSGKKHEVITGVSLCIKNKSQTFSVSTSVYFKELSEEEIDFYIKEYQPYDKAGAYGIQEWIGYIGIEKIEGSYYNVMGLPLKELHEAIQGF